MGASVSAKTSQLKEVERYHSNLGCIKEEMLYQQLDEHQPENEVNDLLINGPIQMHHAYHLQKYQHFDTMEGPESQPPPQSTPRDTSPYSRRQGQQPYSRIVQGTRILRARNTSLGQQVHSCDDPGSSDTSPKRKRNPNQSPPKGILKKSSYNHSTSHHFKSTMDTVQINKATRHIEQNIILLKQKILIINTHRSPSVHRFQS